MKPIPSFIVISILSLGLVLAAACNRVEQAPPRPESEKVVNIPPVANAGPDATINSDRYHLNGSQFQDVAGLSNCDVLWARISGPAGVTISHPAAAITPISDLDKGVYTFRLTVTNRAGVTGSDDVVITVPAQQVKDKVDDYITKEMERQDVKGMSVAIVDGGKIVKVKGYGFTDADRKTPVTPLTLFQAASISKTLTAMGALRLVQDNRLSLDEDVNAKLTSWKVPENGFTKDEKVTLRRLIAHMAGTNMGGFWGYPRGEPFPSLLEILDGKPPANSQPIRVGSVPGTKTEYSGGGYCIIQQLVIDASGQPFEVYMRDNVFSKLGMVSTTFECPLPASKWDFAAHAFGPWNESMAKAGKRLPVPWKWNHYPEMAAAGLWTTAGDLALFVMDIQNTYAGRSSKVIAKDMVDKMLTPVPGNQWKTGLGMVLDNPGAANAAFRASGTNVGFQGQFTGTMQTGQGAVVIYNDRMGEAFPHQIIQFIAQEYAWPK